MNLQYYALIQLARQHVHIDYQQSEILLNKQPKKQALNLMQSRIVTSHRMKHK